MNFNFYSFFFARNLKIVNVSNCVNIVGAEMIYDFLLEFNPDLTIQGLPTLPEKIDNLADYELEHSRFLNMGERPVGLNSTLENYSREKEMLQNSEKDLTSESDEIRNERTKESHGEIDQQSSKKVNL